MENECTSHVFGYLDISHLSAKNYRNLWKFDEVLTKTNLFSFLGHGVEESTRNLCRFTNFLRAVITAAQPGV